MVGIKRLFLIIIFMAAVLFSGASSFGADDQVIAYYFHGDFRCPSCLRIEEYTKGALEEFFGKELGSGALSYRIVNTEKKDNRHFIDDYQLYSKSVVLSLVKDGQEAKFKNLDKAWEYLRDKQKFYDYIKKETRDFLNELTDKKL